MTETEASEPVRASSESSRRAGRPGTTASLAAWREIDWRFALPPMALGKVAFVGPQSEAESEALHALGATIARIDPGPSAARHGADGPADVVILTTPGPAALDVAGGMVRPDGWVLVRTSTAPRWERRLRLAGYEDVVSWWHAPNRTTCSYVVSTTDRVGLRFVLGRWHGTRIGLVKSVVARAVVALGLFPYIAGHATVAGRAPGGDRSAASPAAEPAVLVTPWFEASRHVIKITFRQGTPYRVTKLPRRPGDVSGIRREADSLRWLASAFPAAAERGPRLLPRPSAGANVLVEEPLVGMALRPDQVRADLAWALRIGMGLVDTLPVTGSSRRDALWYDRLFRSPLERFRSNAPAEIGAEELVARTHERLRPLRETRDLPLVFEHGDLGHPNLVVRPSGHLAAVDWERSEPCGLPAHDAVFLLTYLAEARRRAVATEDRLRAFDDAFLGAGAWARQAVAAHLDRRGVDRALLAPLVLACWARSACGLLARLAGTGVGHGLDQDDASLVSDDRDVVLWRHVDRIYGRLR